jgi:hypothetical protein
LFFTLMKNCEAGARHRDRVLVVLQAVARFERNRRARGLLLHVGGEAAALDHEAVDHAVEHRAVVVLVLDVLQEVLDRLGRLGRIEFDHDVAGRGGQLDARCGLLRVAGGGEADGRGQDEGVAAAES